MEMTKERLAAYRSNRQEIKELEYTLNNRWKDERMIGNDVIFDYSKGYPMPQSVVGFDQERYERLQDRDLYRKEFLENECKEIEDFVERIENIVIHRIFRAYYIDGDKKVTQSQVADKINVERSGISKKIDDFLKVSHNSQKSHI